MQKYKGKTIQIANNINKRSMTYCNRVQQFKYVKVNNTPINN